MAFSWPWKQGYSYYRLVCREVTRNEWLADKSGIRRNAEIIEIQKLSFFGRWKRFGGARVFATVVEAEKFIKTEPGQEVVAEYELRNAD